MSRGNLGLLVFVTFVGSIIGGALIGWWLAPSAARAQKTHGVNGRVSFAGYEWKGASRIGARQKWRGGLGADEPRWESETGPLARRSVCRKAVRSEWPRSLVGPVAGYGETVLARENLDGSHVWDKLGLSGPSG